MAAIHETAYPRIKPNLTYKEIDEIFTPTLDDIDFMRSKTKATRHKAQLGFMLLLKCYQYLGRPMMVNGLPDMIKKHVADKLGVDTEANLKRYDISTRKHHLKAVRQYLQINADKKSRRQQLKKSALEAACTRENLADIINVLIDESIKNNFELISYKELHRLAMAARKVVNYHNYQEIFKRLTREQKALIDSILGSKETSQDEGKFFTWATLKLEPKKPTSKNIKIFINHVNKFKNLREQINIDLDHIVPARLEQLRDEAMVTDAADMKKMAPIKRYTLVTILIYMKAATAIDDLVQILITWLRLIENTAKRKLEEYRLKQTDKTDGFVLLLYHILLGIKNNKSATDKINAIEKHMSGDIDKTIEECKEFLGLTHEKHIAWMQKPYKNKRYLLFELLEQLNIQSSSNDKSIGTAISFIKHHRSSHSEWISIVDEELQPDLTILSEAWFKAVTGFKKGITVDKINRLYYEMAIFSVLAGDLNCGDAYIEEAYVYDDPNKQLISWNEFDLEVDDYCKLTSQPREPAQFTDFVQTKLREIAKIVDDGYLQNPYLMIDKGLPILKKIPKKKEHPELEKIKKIIMAEMPLTNIVDVIVDVENWLNLSMLFKPISDYEIKIPDYPPRFVATSLAYGCNMGPTQAERSLLKFTRKQIAWLFNHHVTEKKIINVLSKLINSYNLFELPKHWGSGNSVSVDGTFWDMYKQNLLAAHHIRYGKYGGVGYYHVSDMYIALFSNFISCGAHESIFLLDGIVENDSDVKPNTVHGDSWAQSEVLFGLAPLLAVAVMPRIKHFKHLNFYKASKSDYYDNINELFTEKSIDWELIKTHYYDMLRVAISIQKGRIKASTVLRRLCSKSRKNKLYFAFRELGRAERTIFLLKYINDPELRQMIQAATCKSEEFNQFIDWIRFGGGGVIADNMRFNQRKIIKFNHLLANMIIFHNVAHQTKAINKLINEGVEIPDEVLASISPYWTEHINRFGIFSLDMQKAIANIEYKLNKLEI